MPWGNDESHAVFHREHHRNSRQTAGFVASSRLLHRCIPWVVLWFLPLGVWFRLVPLSLNTNYHLGNRDSLEADGLTVSENKTDIPATNPDETSLSPSLVIPATGLGFLFGRSSFFHLGGVTHERTDLLFVIAQPVPYLWVCFTVWDNHMMGSSMACMH